MSITRDLPLPVRGFVSTTVSVTSSTGGDTVSGTAINGDVIDTRALGAKYMEVKPLVVGSGYSSTMVDRKLALAVKLQSGDSSGGGDMADVSTGSQAADTIFGTTFHTTDFVTWTTGAQKFYAPAGDGTYSLRQTDGPYVRMVVTPTFSGQATATAAAQLLTLQGVMLFSAGDAQPPDGLARDVLNNRMATSTTT